MELKEPCTKLTKQVPTLEEDLSKSKDHHKKVHSKMMDRIKKLEDEVKLLKAKIMEKIVDSTSTSTSNDSNGDEDEDSSK